MRAAWLLPTVGFITQDGSRQALRYTGSRAQPK